MTKSEFDHLFLFSPGTWLGEGKIGFSHSPEELPFCTKWVVQEGVEGVIACKQLVEVTDMGHKLENIFTVTTSEQDSFEITLQNESTPQVLGVGYADRLRIAWEFRGDDFLEGYEEYRRESDDSYTMHAEYLAQDQFRTIIDGRIWLKKG